MPRGYNGEPLHDVGGKAMSTDARISGSVVRGAWIEAARPRTLPLAISGSLVAAGLAAAAGQFRVEVFALMLVVSALLQVIANFADDFGDLAHGLDDETRVGPKRGMQRGIISPAQMRMALVITCSVTFILGCLLIWVAFTAGPAMASGSVTAMIVFLVLGIAAIAAAVFYTVGPHPYGYLGLGDIMSFVFFGLVSVIAGTFLYTHAVNAASLVAALALGLPVAAVMNINNMRDSTADAAKGKKTIANRLYAAGERQGEHVAAGKTSQEIAGLVAVLSHGPKVDAADFEAEVNAGGDEARAWATDPRTVVALTGETYMRSYHLLLVYGSIALFLAALFIVLGWSLPTLVGAVAVLAASMPLFKATRAACDERDHTKLDRFMAPTSLGTVLLAAVFAIAVAIA